jgi:putative methyltransferase (TIGR04325 family)
VAENIKRVLRAILPPICLQAARRVLRPSDAKAGLPPEWEYVPQGWAFARAHPEVAGWNVRSVVETQMAKWPEFMRSVTGPGPLGISHESPDPSAQSPGQHNIIMSFAYVLALAAHRKERLSVLDWGGGLGHYYRISRALLPGVALDYHCRDWPLLCQAGRTIQPEVRFHDSDDCLDRTYDLVLASSSLQYSEDWRDCARRLVASSGDCLFLTRLPVVLRADSFVVLQRPHLYGYHTEYVGWFLNRGALVDAVESAGMRLLREFLLADGLDVPNAPEVGTLRGFLFQKPER